MPSFTATLIPELMVPSLDLLWPHLWEPLTHVLRLTTTVALLHPSATILAKFRISDVLQQTLSKHAKLA